ncbi:MAG: restriction modification system specificity domain [Bacteroidetes bacterium]|nr:restriction modification system specificity domain [Bacteroidota bacterium]
MNPKKSNWEWIELGKILDIQGGSQPPKSTFKYVPQNGYIQLLQIRDFGKRGLPTYVPINKVSKFCKKEDIMIARYGASLGRIVTGLEGAYNVALAKVIDPQNLFDKKFVFYLLKTPIFQSPLKLLSRSAQNGFSKSELANIKLPVPSLPIQKSIVSKIEELFSELDKGVENLKNAQQQLRTYRQSVLKWAFEGRLTNKNLKEGELPKGWRIVTITELAAPVKHALKAGPFGSSLKKEFYTEKGFKIYGQEQVINNDAFYGNYFISKEKYNELLSCKVKPKDILISLVGTVGKVLLLPENCEEGIINPRLVKISLDDKKYSPKFFKYYFESSAVKAFYKSETRGTTMDVLNLGIIKTIPFPLCSLNEQTLIINEVENRLSVADKIEENINQSLEQAEALRQSILRKAFEGGLV